MSYNYSFKQIFLLYISIKLDKTSLLVTKLIKIVRNYFFTLAKFLHSVQIFFATWHIQISFNVRVWIEYGAKENRPRGWKFGSTRFSFSLFKITSIHEKERKQRAYISLISSQEKTHFPNLMGHSLTIQPLLWPLQKPFSLKANISTIFTWKPERLN